MTRLAFSPFSWSHACKSIQAKRHFLPTYDLRSNASGKSLGHWLGITQTSVETQSSMHSEWGRMLCSRRELATSIGDACPMCRLPVEQIVRDTMQRTPSYYSIPVYAIGPRNNPCSLELNALLSIGCSLCPRLGRLRNEEKVQQRASLKCVKSVAGCAACPALGGIPHARFICRSARCAVGNQPARGQYCYTGSTDRDDIVPDMLGLLSGCPQLYDAPRQPVSCVQPWEDETQPSQKMPPYWQ